MYAFFRGDRQGCDCFLMFWDLILRQEPCCDDFREGVFFKFTFFIFVLISGEVVFY